MLPLVPILILLAASSISSVWYIYSSLPSQLRESEIFIRCQRIKGLLLPLVHPWSTPSPTSMVLVLLPTLTARRIRVFYGARTAWHSLASPSHPLPSPPRSCCFPGALIWNGGGSLLLSDPQSLSDLSEISPPSFSVDLKDSSLLTLPTGTPGLNFSPGVEFY